MVSGLRELSQPDVGDTLVKLGRAVEVTRWAGSQSCRNHVAALARLLLNNHFAFLSDTVQKLVQADEELVVADGGAGDAY